MGHENITISAESLRRFMRDAYAAVGLAPNDAELAADVLATADEFGVTTHGVKLLPAYLRRLKAGGTRGQGQPHVISEGPAWAQIDGDAALGAVVGAFAMRTAIAKARSSGIAYSGVRNSGHFGAAGYYSLLASREGMVGLSVANDTPSVVAPGAMNAVLGTNPFSYAIPAGKHPPILLDMATSTVAGGKVYQARQLGKSIPDNWIVGRDGLPTVDANLYPEKAALVPVGGYKGFGLALLVEALAGLLSGAAVTFGIGSWMWIDPSLPTYHGAAFIAIDPSVFGPRDEFYARVDALIDEIHATPALEGIQRIIVPGEREFERLSRSKHEPLTLTADVSANLRAAAEAVGLDVAAYL